MDRHRLQSGIHRRSRLLASSHARTGDVRYGEFAAARRVRSGFGRTTKRHADVTGWAPGKRYLENAIFGGLPTDLRPAQRSSTIRSDFARDTQTMMLVFAARSASDSSMSR